MDVAFIINPVALDGLAATLVSLLRNSSYANSLSLWFFCSGCKAKHKNLINKLLHGENFSGTTNFVDFDARKSFGHLMSLHGDWTCYGRLLIPDYIDSDVVLYLDADLIVSVDVLELKNFAFDGKFLGAVPGGTFEHTMERNLFLEELQQPPNAAYFNSGVLLFNLEQWKLEGVQTKWKDMSSKYPEFLISHDQTLLNAVCGGQFAFMPACFNNHWFPGNSIPDNADHSIIHFVGSPKPWDAFGKQLHKGYKLWLSYNPGWWHRSFNQLSWNKTLRTWRIKNSILLKFKSKFFG